MTPESIAELCSRVDRLKRELDVATSLLNKAEYQLTAAEEAWRGEKRIGLSELRTDDDRKEHVAEIDRLFAEWRRLRDRRNTYLERKSRLWSQWYAAAQELLQVQTASDTAGYISRTVPGGSGAGAGLALDLATAPRAR